MEGKEESQLLRHEGWGWGRRGGGDTQATPRGPPDEQVMNRGVEVQRGSGALSSRKRLSKQMPSCESLMTANFSAPSHVFPLDPNLQIIHFLQANNLVF